MWYLHICQKTENYGLKDAFIASTWQKHFWFLIWVIKGRQFWVRVIFFPYCNPTIAVKKVTLKAVDWLHFTEEYFFFGIILKHKMLSSIERYQVWIWLLYLILYTRSYQGCHSNLFFFLIIEWEKNKKNTMYESCIICWH